MIFVVVGTSPFPFDRLIRAMDLIAEEKSEEVFIQTGSSRYPVRNAKSKSFLNNDEYENALAASRVIVSHAGVGTVMDARRFKKPIIVIARRKDLHESSDNHQRSTIEELAGMTGVFVADSELRLKDLINEATRTAWNDKESIEKQRIVDYVGQLFDFVEANESKGRIGKDRMFFAPFSRITHGYGKEKNRGQNE